MTPDLVLLAISLSLSCLGLLSVLFSTSGKGPVYLLGLSILWLVVLLAAAAAWTAVVGRVPAGVAVQITGWYWWLLPVFCGYVSYQNYRQQEFSGRQILRLRLIGAVVCCVLLIALVAALWPVSIAPAVGRLEENQHVIIRANSALADSIGQIDAKLSETRRLDSLQTDSLIMLHSELLDREEQTAADLATMETTLINLKQPSYVAPASATLAVADTPRSRRDRRRLRRANRKVARERRQAGEPRDGGSAGQR